MNWFNSLGEDAKVVVIDSGCDNRPHLNIVEYRNFTNVSDWILTDHGSAMADIIGGGDTDHIGIAPYCKLYIAKAWSGPRLTW